MPPPPPVNIKKTGKPGANFKASRPGLGLNGKDTSQMMGVSEQSLNNWVKKGCPWMPHPTKKNIKLYDSAKVVEWYLGQQQQILRDQLIGNVEQVHDQMSESEAKRRGEVAKTKLAELKLANEQKLVANIDAIMGNVADAVTNACAVLQSWSNTLPGLFAHKDEEELQDLIVTEVGNVLEELQGYKHEYKEKD